MAHRRIKSVSHKMTQGLILIILMIAGMLFTKPADAHSNHKSKNPPTKKFAVHSNAHRSCYILYKKRMGKKNDSFSIVRSRREKNKRVI